MSRKRKGLKGLLLSFIRKCGFSTSKQLPAGIKVGWYAFKGGKFSPDPNAYPNLQGVVVWINPDPNVSVGQRGLFLTPDEVRISWSDNTFYACGVNDEEDGQANTQELVDLVKKCKHRTNFPAAEWCYNYSKNGVKPGDGFLPAFMQLKRVFANREVIDSALGKIGGALLEGWIWSSTEEGKIATWQICYDGHFTTRRYLCKDSLSYARCMIAF